MIEPCYWIPQVRLEAVDEIKMFAMQIEFIFFFILLLVFIPLHPRPHLYNRVLFPADAILCLQECKGMQMIGWLIL